MSDDAAVTRALLASKLDDLNKDVCNGFDKVTTRLDRMNGTQQQHTLEITSLKLRTDGLERFRDMATKALMTGLGTGVGIAITAGGILFGIGKAVSWW